MTTEPKKTTKKKSQTYNTIEQLDAIEHIRLRPGMYIGTNDTPAHLFSEVIDNALDEAANGYCNRIDITYKDHIVTIQDNGRGIPHSKTNKGQEAIIAATENMSGGKFNRDNYAKAVGLHGVGLCAVRALSDFLTISSVRDGEEYCAKFNDANLVSFEKKQVSGNQGTFVQFRPCTKYFESDDIPISYVIERVRVALTEIRKLKIFFNDEELHPYSDEELLANSDIKFPLMSGSDKNNNEMFLRLGYTTVGLQSDEAGSVNLLPVNAGTHVDIAKKALIEAWNLTGYIDDLELKPEDVLVGSHLYASASFVETAWTSQDKKQLKMRIKEFDDLIKSLAKNIMRSIQQLSKESKDALLRKFIDYRESQNRLSTAKYMQGVVKYGDEGKTTKRSFSSDSKLVDCVSEDRESTELFVCLHRDTEVKLLDGTVHTIKDLAENFADKEFEVYSWNMNEKKVIKAIAYNPRITGQTNKYVHIEVGDRKVDCTFDHKFVDYRTQKFVEARNLKIGDTLCTEDGESEVTLIESVYISEYEDVYCLTVKNEFHTFMLANGLITKNCEGNSAGSNLISQRDPMIHAVLPLRGKPRNIMEESVETILNNLEMRSIVNSLGTGLMKHERPELCRYGKIIITADADCFTGDMVFKCGGSYKTFEEAEKIKSKINVKALDQDGNFVTTQAMCTKSRKVSYLSNVYLSNGSLIKCTPDHKFMLDTKEYRCAEDLSIGDCLYNDSTDKIYVESSLIEVLNKPIQMYDLIVPEYNNFVLESGVLVHNCDGLQISSLVLAALCYLVPKTVLSGRVYLLTAPLYGIFGQNITEFEVEGKEPRYYLSSDKLIVNNVEMLSKDIKKNSQCKDKAGNEFLVKSVKKYDKKEFIPLWECYTSPSIQLKRYKGLGSMSPEESKIALLSDKRRLQMITGTSIDKVMKLVGETEFKKILMKQNDILDWQC